MKHKTLYLYLTLACFVGIILIFVFDGYLGLYDGLTMDNGQYKQKVEPDQWDSERYGWLASMDMERGGSIEFVYTVENHRFSVYKADIQISLYYQHEKVTDILTETIEAKAFENSETKWTLSAAEILPGYYPTEQAYNAYLLLKRGEVEHRINIYINPPLYPVKTVPVPLPD